MLINTALMQVLNMQTTQLRTCHLHLYSASFTPDLLQASCDCCPADHPLVVLHVQPHCPQAIAGGVGSADMSWQQDNAINDEMVSGSAFSRLCL